MRSSDVSFRKNGEMDIIEIKYPDGKVSAFPADAVSPESGQKYSNLYARKYQAFKSGDNSERVEQLKSEIAARQAELDGMKKPVKSEEKPVAEKPVAKKAHA